MISILIEKEEVIKKKDKNGKSINIINSNISFSIKGYFNQNSITDGLSFIGNYFCYRLTGQM